MPLEPGDDAPTISARNQDGEPVELDFATPTVLYFYPRDDTSGCTTEATQFQAELAAYRDAGVSVYGVSTDDVDSHAAFAADQGLEFDLLADPGGELARAFDVELDETSGKPAAARTTFVLADGVVEATYTGVDPDGHARSVLSELRESDVLQG